MTSAPHPHIWFPFTQAKTAPLPPKVVSASGAWLELEGGHRVMDCISSWWVNTHGHAHPEIAAAIAEQAQRLEHVIFAGFTHDPAEQLATQLIERFNQKINGTLSRVFFSDNGSTAVEVALKMAYQYWVNQGQPRQTFLAFEGAYHGDTIGAMSVGARSLFSQVFDTLLFDVEFLPFPETWIGDTSIAEREAAVLDLLDKKFSQNPDRYAGVIIEPLVQGAGGMRMCRSAFLQSLRSFLHEQNCLLIFDEVMTGFGRTGDWFASHRSETMPDIVCLSKGLTGGFLPLAVTLCTEEIYTTFYSTDPLKTLYHGHSYTANPLGCAAALAGMKLMEVHEPVFSQMEEQHRHHLQALQSHPRLSRLRTTGTIAAMDIVTENESAYLNPISTQVRQKAIEKGFLLRPLGNVLYLLPPYCVDSEELSSIYRCIAEVLSEL